MIKNISILLITLIVVLFVYGFGCINRNGQSKYNHNKTMGVNSTSNEGISAVFLNFIPIINNDIERFNGKNLGQIKSFRKDYRISDDPYMGIIINIIRFDASNCRINEGLDGNEWKRDLKKEKNQFILMKEGSYRGDIHVFNEGYQYSDYSVKIIGANKFIVVYSFSPSGGTYQISFTTFNGNQLMELVCYMQDNEIIPEQGVGGNIALVIGFKKERYKLIKDLEQMTGEIFKL